MMEATAADPTTARLQALAGDNPRMVQIVTYFRYLGPALIEAAAHIQPVTLPAAKIEMKLKSGVPLLVGEEWGIDPQNCRDIFRSISWAARRGFDTSGDDLPGGLRVPTLPLERIIQNIENDNLYPLALLNAINNNRADLLSETATRLDLDARLLELLAKSTLKAFLHAWQKSLQLGADLRIWQRGLCPFCGNFPTLAEIQGVERARYLRCLQCGARWPYPNLKCAFCGNDDHYTLGILQLDSESHKYYVHMCDQCRRYIKTIITFDPLPVEHLLAEDLASLHLDTMALEKGYK